MTIKMLLAVILFLTLTLSFANAQESRWLGFESGWATHRLQDKGHSPLIYKGQTLFLGLSFDKQTEKFYSSLYASIVGSELKPDLSDQIDYELNIAQRNSIYGAYSLLKTGIASGSGVSVDFGGKISALYDFAPFSHSANNLVSYELSIALNPTVAISYKVSEKLSLKYSGSIPLLAYSIRPNPLGFFPLNDFDVDMGKILTGGKLVTVNKFFNVHSRISTTFLFKEKQLSLFYDHFGGINTLSERKGFSFNKIGIQVPLNISRI